MRCWTAVAAINASTTAYPPTRATRGAQPGRTGPSVAAHQQRQPGQQDQGAHHVHPVDRGGGVRRRARPGDPHQPDRTGREGQRLDDPVHHTTSRATSHSPPPSQASRAEGAGRSSVSASRACTQSRRLLAQQPGQAPHQTGQHPHQSIHHAPPSAASRRRAARPAAGRRLARRLGQRRAGGDQALGGEPVQVPARASGRLLVLPPRLDQPPLGQPDQDRVQRARRQPGLFGDQVPVQPRGRVRLERGQHGQCLGGEPRTTSHDTELYLGRGTPSRPHRPEVEIAPFPDHRPHRQQGGVRASRPTDCSDMPRRLTIPGTGYRQPDEPSPQSGGPGSRHAWHS